jgi:hypothetical protein
MRKGPLLACEILNIPYLYPNFLAYFTLNAFLEGFAGFDIPGKDAEHPGVPKPGTPGKQNLISLDNGDDNGRGNPGKLQETASWAYLRPFNGTIRVQCTACAAKPMGTIPCKKLAAGACDPKKKLSIFREKAP